MSGLAFDSAGDLYVGDNDNNQIFEIQTNGTENTFVNNLGYPGALAFDSAGDLFVVDNGNNKIFEFTNCVASEEGIFATNLNGPDFLAFSPSVRPSLSIASVGGQSVLFWPASATNYVLQSTTNLASPNWVTASDAVPVIAFTVTNSSPARFFRLQQQQ